MLWILLFCCGDGVIDQGRVLLDEWQNPCGRVIVMMMMRGFNFSINQLNFLEYSEYQITQYEIICFLFYHTQKKSQKILYDN
jgi:hypothetical protein